MNIRLFTPGPTPVPEEVLRASAAPMIHHRSEEFGQILASVRHRLNWLADNDGESLVFSSSGSGAMEACVSSFFEAGDEVVILVSGKFGERWVALAEHFGLKSQVVHVEWGRAVTVDQLLAVVSPHTKGVLIQACESSTGVYHPVSEIGSALKAHKNLLFVVDAITALGVHDLSMKRDRIDALLCGSQKALMCPPGLATVSLSPRALDRLSHVKSRGFYFSLQRELKAQKQNSTAFTPAISLFRALDKGLGMIEQEGKEALWKRHKALQKMARAALSEIGLELFNKDTEASLGITAVCVSEGMDVKAWLKTLKKEHGLWLAGGQGELEGKIFRLSHMGACGTGELLDALKTIEDTLANRYPGAKTHKGSKRAKEIALEAV